jgi:hypothetical protein
MGTGGILLAASLFAGQLIQSSLPNLTPPAGVDVNVSEVTWNPSGTALLYTKKQTDSTGIGVYASGQKEGRVLLSVGDGDTYKAQWFECAPFVAVIIYRSPKEAEGRLQAEVHLLDAKALKSRLLFSRTFDRKSGVEIDVDPSPGLVHAIFRVKEGEARRHMVLPISLGPLAAAPDLDRAVEQGFRGPSWSIDGTAVYAKDVPNPTAGNVHFDPATGLMRARFELAKGSKVPVFGDIPLLNKFFLAGPPTPPAGHPVLEVVPSNGALRQVRFRGAWEEVEPEVEPLGSVAQKSPLRIGVSRGEANSLWLTRGEEAPERGVLITPHGGQVWLAPRNRAVAYVVDGALFVREITK